MIKNREFHNGSKLWYNNCLVPKSSSFSGVSFSSELVPMVLWAYKKHWKIRRQPNQLTHIARDSVVKCKQVKSACTKLGARAKKTESEVPLLIYFALDPIFTWRECWVFVEECLLHKFASNSLLKKCTTHRNMVGDTFHFSSWISNGAHQ